MSTPPKRLSLPDDIVYRLHVCSEKFLEACRSRMPVEEFAEKFPHWKWPVQRGKDADAKYLRRIASKDFADHLRLSLESPVTMVFKRHHPPMTCSGEFDPLQLRNGRFLQVELDLHTDTKELIRDVDTLIRGFKQSIGLGKVSERNRNELRMHIDDYMFWKSITVVDPVSGKRKVKKAVESRKRYMARRRAIDRSRTIVERLLSRLGLDR